MTKQQMGLMLAAIAGVVVLTALATGSLNQSANVVETYYSPVDYELGRKYPFVTISDQGDHHSISYRPHCSGKNCISEIIESRWEDGSVFYVIADGRPIFQLPEAGPYWGYRRDKDISVFFVDDATISSTREMNRYGDLPYNYELITTNRNGSKQYSCSFNTSRLEESAAKELSGRTVDGMRPNPLMLPISKFLAERGTDLKADNCRFLKTLN